MTNTSSIHFTSGHLDAQNTLLRLIEGECFRRVVVVQDSNVDGCLMDYKVLAAKGIDIHAIPMQGGEGCKTVSTYLWLVDKLDEAKVTRNDLIIAVGGGTIGDLVGFVAMTYLRGIALIHVPTTLLAMIDSSIGGKNGINTPVGKNRLGGFYQPIAVIVDTDYLGTLPEEEWNAGMGELLKYACIIPDGMRLLHESFSLDDKIRICARFKESIVAKDPYDKGERMVLNLGHTLAHAYEQEMGYNVSHGVAVAGGVWHMARVARKNGCIDEKAYALIETTAKALGAPDMRTMISTLSKHFLRDKKMTDNLKLVMLSTHGTVLCDLSIEAAIGILEDV